MFDTGKQEEPKVEQRTERERKSYFLLQEIILKVQA